MAKILSQTIVLLLLMGCVFSLKQAHDLTVKQAQQSHLEQQNQLSQHKGLGLRRESPQQSHKYWFNKNHPTDSILSSARQWNYCDYKCLYLQKYNTNKDFVVVVMGAFLKQDFSACYVKSGQDYTLWNQIMTNKFYEQNCGQDQTDWMKSGKFDVKGIYGVGIGTNLNEAEIYQ